MKILKKYLLALTLFFILSIPITNANIIEGLDYSHLTQTGTITNVGTGSIMDYTELLNDNNKLLTQQLFLQIMNTFFFLLFVFYTFTNDLLGKK